MTLFNDKGQGRIVLLDLLKIVPTSNSAPSLLALNFLVLFSL